jgi:hypothetical protein
MTLRLSPAAPESGRFRDALTGELSNYVEEGRLRDAVRRELSEEATDLLVDVVRRFCRRR